MAVTSQRSMRHLQTARTDARCHNASRLNFSRNRTRSLTIAQAAKVEKFPRWPAMWNYMLKQNLESASPELANQYAASGDWVFVDVRPKPSYEKAHIAGAVSCPLYQPLDMSAGGFQTYLKFAVYTFNGVAPIEMNPTFSEDLAKITSSGKGVIFYCEAGGTMKPSPNFENGKSSRSLQAVFRTIREEISSKVKHLDGGIYAWYQGGLPIDGDYDTSDVGRTPNAAATPTGLKQ